MTQAPKTPRPRLLAALALTVTLAAQGVQAAGCEAETGLLVCQDLGAFTAGVVRATPSDAKHDRERQYRTVAVVVRLRNTSAGALALAYRDGSLRVADNNGNTFNGMVAAERRVSGIGLAKGRSADPQLQLAPGQSRELRFEARLMYDTRNHKPFGDQVAVDFTLAELRLPNATQMEFVRDHAVSLTGARVSAFGGFAAGGNGGPASGSQAASQLLQDLHKLANKKK